MAMGTRLAMSVPMTAAPSVAVLSSALLLTLAPPTKNLTQDPAPSCQVRGSHQWLSQRASPLDSATVSVGGRMAKVCYSRPSARGRQVFGGLVQYGTAWRTGANEPTVLHLPFPAEVAGVRLQAGRYMLFTVPRPDAWLVVFYESDAVEAVEMFRSMRLVGQGTAPSEALSAPVDTFTIRGIDGAPDGQLLLEWERVRVRVPIRSLSNER
jgi:hypothetical protein